MPVYDYRNADEIGCDYCRVGFAVRQHMTDRPLELCPRCGAAVQRAVVSFYASAPKFGKTLNEKRAKQAGFSILRRDDRGKWFDS